jgi:hypothetical protein
MAEAFKSLFKAELVRNRGPWKGIDDLEIAGVPPLKFHETRDNLAPHALSGRRAITLSTHRPCGHGLFASV